MADPTIPDPNATQPAVTPFVPTPEQTTLINNYTTAVQNNSKAQGDLDTILGNVSTSMDMIGQKLNTAGVSLNNLSSLTNTQLQQFTVLTTGVIKAREAFEGLAGIDYTGLSTLSDVMVDLKEAFASGGTAAADLTSAVGILGKKLVDAGVPQSAITEAFKKGGSAVVDLAVGLMKHADNMTRAQNAYLQMTAATGDLGNAWNAAGGDLQNMNDLVHKQTEMLGDTIEATGLSAKQVENYYSQLGQIPGALTAVIDTSEKGGATTSMLTAAIEVAAGTGRKYTDVMTDLKTAFRDYGLVGEDALRFSTRMSDVSTNLKAPIEDVTTALRGSADAFKMFATGQEAAASSAESLGKTLNTYGKALESTGLSATAAVEVAGNLSNQVARLSTGQLAFISQQTGGPGGLQGAARETLKLQTDPGAVVRDAMKTLQQQFGRIVTVQEAATSEAAASQNIKQTTMLQNLLGPLAKDQATANRLLEAMKNEAAGQPGAIAEELKPTTVQDATERGLKVQQGSYSELTKIRGQMERMRYLADQGAGRSFQAALTPRIGTEPAGLAQGEMKTNLSEAMRTSRERGGTQVAATAAGLASGKVSDTVGVDAARAMHTALSSLKDVPTILRSMKETFMGLLPASAQSTIKQQQEDLQSRTAASRVGSAVGNAAARPAGATAPQTGTGALPANVPGTAGANTMNIVGKITIDCPHCGKPHDASNQFKITSGPAGQAGQ